MGVLQSLVNGTVNVLVMSPDIFLNLLVDERNLLRMTDVSLIVFDEAHNCLGRHPYAKIMERYGGIAEKYEIPCCIYYLGQCNASFFQSKPMKKPALTQLASGSFTHKRFLVRFSLFDACERANQSQMLR
jgi:hypothetical protein